MNQRATKWVLFAAMVCTMPVLYFMFVVAGVLPLVTAFLPSSPLFHRIHLF